MSRIKPVLIGFALFFTLTIFTACIPLDDLTFDFDILDTGPGGGLIFYDKGEYTDGWRWLESAPSSTEWVSKEWGPSVGVLAVLAGANDIVIGAGEQNTIDIVTTFGTGDTYAGQLCDALVSGGYDDWFLPSRDELNQMYLNLHLEGVGGFAAELYWSSSELDRFMSLDQDMSNGVQWDNVARDDNLRVRAIRAF